MKALGWALLIFFCELAGANSREAEFRVVLSRAGYDRLVSRFPEPETVRTDFYFGSWNCSGFARPELGSPKLRLKVRDGQVEAQESRVVRVERISVDKVPVLYQVTESLERDLRAHGISVQVAASQALDGFGHNDLLRLGEKAGELFATASGFSVGQEWRLLPYHRSQKFRRKRVFLVSKTKVAVILGRTQLQNEQGQNIDLFELEAEPEPEHMHQSVESTAREIIAAILGSERLAAEDLSLDSVDKFFLAEQAYRDASSGICQR